MARRSPANPASRVEQRRPAARSWAADLARFVAAGTVFVVLAWPIVTHGLAASALRAGRAEEVLAMTPGAADALAATAGERLQTGRPAEAMALSRAALARAPLHAAALRNLGLAAGMSGDPVLAARAMGQAAALGWRDPATQAWLVAAATNAGDYDGALVHFDALVRAHGLVREVEEVIDDFAARPAVRPALLRRLRTDPPWRTAYFTDLEGLDTATLLARARLLTDLVNGGGAAGRSEVVGLEQGLVRARQPLAGYRLWQAISGARIGRVYDPGFARVQGDANRAVPFAWTILPLAGANAVAEPAAGGNAVHLATTGSARGPLLRQFVALGAGDHRLTVRVRTGAPHAADAFRMQLACLPAGLPGFRSAPVHSDGGTTINLAVTLPAGELCAVQTLEFAAQTTEAGGAADIWIDDLTLS